ncbi:MAG: hypothetical protein IJ475_01395 [Bacilli bacterium]|nr:hypothetical protein [Bacilli bacterium]
MLFKKDIVKVIDNYLSRKGHEKIFTINLKKYNGNNIYIRFDYVKTLKVYKIAWVDLKFVSRRNIADYINMHIVTNTLSNKVLEILCRMELESGDCFNDKIMGDRVELVNYVQEYVQEYKFDRFLPVEWKVLVDPIVIIFSYLPRSMECFINEIFAKLDGTEEKFNYVKPVKFDLFKSDVKELFKPAIIARGGKYYEEERVVFLEKVNDKYISIVEGEYPYLVIFHMIDDEHVVLWCNCKHQGYCKHTHAALMALRKNEIKPFYKVKYQPNKDETLLDKVVDGGFNLCFGVEEDNLLLVSNDGGIITKPIIENGRCVFEVLEDDDELSLSEYLEKYKVK